MSKYESIAKDLETKIVTRFYDSGSLMPTETELCSKYNVSRITIRKALEELEKEKLITRVQGKGTFAGKEKIRSDASFKGFKSNMAEQGILVTSKVILKEIVSSSGFASNALGIKDNAELYRFKRIRYANNSPIAIMDTFVKKELGEKMIEEGIEETSFYALYKKIFSEEIADTKGTIRAVLGTKEEYEMLEIKEKSPLLWFRSISYLENGEAVQVDYSLFDSESYEFVINMKNGMGFKRED